jgi:hypothetical protein
MKKNLLIALTALGILFSVSPFLRGSDTDAEATVTRIRASILDPNFKPDGIEKSLVEILDVSLAILPQKEYATEFKSKIEWVKNSFAEKHLFSDKIRQYLGIAYQLVSNGAAWQLPEELEKPYTGEKPAIEQATKVCGRYLESALAEMKAGNSEKAVRHLVGFVIMVVTPVEA